MVVKHGVLGVQHEKAEAEGPQVQEQPMLYSKLFTNFIRNINNSTFFSEQTSISAL